MKTCIYIFICVIFMEFFNEINNERIHNSNCESVKNVQNYRDCVGKKPKDNNYYCCYSFFSYIGNEAKYCFEFPKKDIDNYAIKDTINKIEKGIYWEGEIQTYDVYNLQCDKGNFIKINYLAFYMYLILCI